MEDIDPETNQAKLIHQFSFQRKNRFTRDLEENSENDGNRHQLVAQKSTGVYSPEKQRNNYDPRNNFN